MSPPPLEAGAQPVKPNDVPDLYRGADGSEAQLMRNADSPKQWVMLMTAPDDKPITLYLEGDAAAMTPRAAEVTVEFNGAPVSLYFEGDQLYASMDKGETRDEWVSGRGAADGFYENGVLASTDDSKAAEAALALAEYKQVWQLIRQARVSAGRDGLAIASGVQNNRNLTLARAAALSPEQIAVLAARNVARTQYQAAANHLTDSQNDKKGNAP